MMMRGEVWKKTKTRTAFKCASDTQVKGKGDDLPASPIKVGNKSFRQNSKLQQVLDEI